MPPELEAYGETFRRHHPEWKFVLWNESNLPKLRNQALFDRASSYAQKSDIARYEILYEHGGVYIDTDFECLKPLDSLLEGVTCFTATEDNTWFNIAILGAIPKHPFFDAVIRHIPLAIAASPGGAANVQTGPVMFTRLVLERRQAGIDDVVVFPRELFYPYYVTEPHKRNGPFPSAYAVHHWLASWARPKAPAAEDNPSPAPPALVSEFPQRPRVLVAADLTRGETIVPLLVTFGRLFGAKDNVELAFYAYREPTPDILDVLLGLLRSVAPRPDLAPIGLYSKDELASVPFDAAYFPTGNPLDDARSFDDAARTMYRIRLAIDHGSAELLSAVRAPARAEILGRANAPPPAPLPPARQPEPRQEPRAGLHGTYIGQDRVLIHTLWNARIVASSKDLSLMPYLVTTGIYDVPLTRFLVHRLKPGNVAFDVGANIGLFTVLMGKLVGPTGSVIGYEAEPENAALARENVSMNYLGEWATIVERAAYREAGSLRFFAKKRFHMNGSLRANAEEYAKKYPADELDEIQVVAEPLDVYVSRWPVIDFVKIDVEGGELDVFRGMQQLFAAKKVHTVAFECIRYHFGEDWPALMDQLAHYHRDFGARFFSLSEHGTLMTLPLATIDSHGEFTQVVMEFPR
jgi:FkbM family methyltransferase